ncbi:hypothetical protein [Klebsiella pneumoniae]|uniref:hypothetical protein n=1 Tax=Klebsiella pneumoniae TaxID=573 RepID=UPI00115E2546|nr:hypothetical protein [Klebsiella pneumoniae]
MGLSLYRFSRVPGESWMVFSCLLGFGGCPNACDKSSGVFWEFLSLASFGWWYAGSALSVMMEGFA